jgi:hypothetical protein
MRIISFLSFIIENYFERHFFRIAIQICSQLIGKSSTGRIAQRLYVGITEYRNMDKFSFNIATFIENCKHFKIYFNFLRKKHAIDIIMEVMF